MRDARLTRHAATIAKPSPSLSSACGSNCAPRGFKTSKFRRQKVIGDYIADFAANDPKLVIELDGDRHAATSRV